VDTESEGYRGGRLTNQQKLTARRITGHPVTCLFYCSSGYRNKKSFDIRPSWADNKADGYRGGRLTNPELSDSITVLDG